MMQEPVIYDQHPDTVNQARQHCKIGRKGPGLLRQKPADCSHVEAVIPKRTDALHLISGQTFDESANRVGHDQAIHRQYTQMPYRVTNFFSSPEIRILRTAGNVIYFFRDIRIR